MKAPEGAERHGMHDDPANEHLTDDVDDTALADSLALSATDDDPRHDVLVGVGEQLQAARSTRGLTLEAAANAAGIAPERLAAAEEGLEGLDEPELSRFAGLYGVDVTAFFGGRVTPLNYLAGA